MCGFLGELSYNDLNSNYLNEANNYIVCRGPDSTKNFSNTIKNLKINLFFNRLKIIDLSENADQPMFSDKYQTISMFNGEIYNHKDLRKEMEKIGIHFKTHHSDSEVVLNGLSHFGVDFVKKLRGQFSIFFYEVKKSRAYLINDRVGQKPLYYNFDNKSLRFSSNLISLLKFSGNHTINEDKVYEYLNYGITSMPNTIFKNFYKIQPAEIIEVIFSENKNQINKHNYWNLTDHLNNNEFEEDKFLNILNESINLRSNADVPIANFLSGGIDSTVITKNLYNQGFDVNTFSVILDNEKYNEEEWSSTVAQKYKTNHHTVKVSSGINIDNINDALNSLDEPYSDPSVVPSYILSNEISKYFKVAISGDGGDELLGGYKRTQLSLTRKSLFDQFISKLYPIYPAFLGTGNYFLSKSDNLETAYGSFFSDEKFIKLLKIKRFNNLNPLKPDNSLEPFKSLLLQDFQYYLPQMMMFKVDRTSMANSLEVRSPFVDHRLIEYVLSTIHREGGLNVNKNVLKNYLKKDFSSDFIHREKKGFVFDLENWVYGNKSYISTFLNQGKIASNFPSSTISKLSINKTRINANRIWKLFVLEHYLART